MAKAKLKPLGNLSLFEAPQSEPSSPLTEKDSHSPDIVKIKDACPRCGSRSLKTVRPFEHDNHSHYCSAGCLSEDRTDAFYFTPRAESFDEQAEREEAKRIVSELSPGEQIVKEAFDNVSQETLREIDEKLGTNVAREIEIEEVGLSNGDLADLFGNPIEKKQAGALAERFLVPPFSVLDARQGYWKTRKAEWLAMGISGEDGRSDEVLFSGEVKDFDYMGRKNGEKKSHKGVLHKSDKGYDWDEGEYEGGTAWRGSGSSIFDPVLCELAYKWFAPAGGKVLDPFAGGSTRGVVAEKLGYKYTGIELRKEQIDANTVQAKKISVAPQWICGDSSKMDSLVAVPPYEEMFDMIFTCPPYYDLEEYSESREDGSAKQTYEEFLIWYKVIFGACVKRLKWNRFLVIVVGEIRDENGFYRNFVGDTITCMLSLGLRYYNEAILITSVGSLPLRVNNQFGGYRKLGKTHQNVLVFYKGSNCDQIQEKFGNLL